MLDAMLDDEKATKSGKKDAIDGGLWLMRYLTSIY